MAISHHLLEQIFSLDNRCKQLIERQRIEVKEEVKPDGNVRLYSLKEGEEKWLRSWQAFSQLCQIPGICRQTVYVAIFLILVEYVLAFQDIR